MRGGLGGFGAKNGVGYTIRTVEGVLCSLHFADAGRMKSDHHKGHTKESQPAARQNGSGRSKKMLVDARGTA